MFSIARLQFKKQILTKNALSTIAESPRMTIAKNLLLFNQIAATKDDAALSVAAKSSPVLDSNALPADLVYFKKYLASPSGASVAPFVSDSTAWQNMSWSSYVVAETSRFATWPFAVSALVVYILFGLGIPLMLPEEGRKTSRYVELLERNKPKVHDSSSHHH